MGDEELVMKKFILILIIVSASFANQGLQSKLIDKYRELFTKIEKKRVGIDHNDIIKTNSPFVISGGESKSVVKKVNGLNQLLNLEAILGSSAKISGRWYKVNQKVGDKKIISIGKNVVTFKSGRIVEKLVLGGRNANISIK
jgi:hypothetical protein